MDLSLSNVVNISVSQSQMGIGRFSTSNVALLSHEPFAGSFGALGYKIYLDPTQVAVDFGSASQTYAQAVAIFSQNPNILAGDGYLVIFPLVVTLQHLAFSGVSASGQFVLHFGAGVSAPILWNDTAAMIQAKLRAIVGLEQCIVTGSIATSLNVSLYGAAVLMTVSGDTLQDAGAVAVTIAVTAVSAGEDLVTAYNRTKALVQYFGVLGTVIFPQADMLAAAAVIQTELRIAFFASANAADANVGGMLDLLRSGNLSRSRGLLYVGTGLASDALNYAAAYVGRALSTNFSGSNATQTMHMKDLSTIQPDAGMSQTILNACILAGVDVYASFRGVPKVFCTKGNTFFDRVYNLLAAVGDLQIAGFNAIAQATTKLPQTEDGVQVLKNAYRQVCEQYVTNQYLAPGAWNSASTFGILADFYANIKQRGYYIFSLPVALQLAVDRDGRKAPPIQIAFKEAGAIHESDVIVNVNS
jgi:hypothetical protein